MPDINSYCLPDIRCTGDFRCDKVILMMTCGNLFSGIEGFGLGLELSGLCKTIWHAEIDKYASAVHEYHYFDMRNYGDATKIKTSELPNTDIITFGWPCQDNSIAGKRKGHRDGTRSNLLTEAVRIIGAQKPKYFIAENVPGLFSVNGGYDFYEAIRLFTDIGYDCQWQVLNTGGFLPQNRERIYIIGIRKDLPFKSIFPIIPDKYIHREVQYEKVYEVSEELSRVFKAFFERQKVQGQSYKMVQELFKRISKSVEQKASPEIERETEEIRQFGKEGLSEAETIVSCASGNDNSGRLYNVVQIPTTEMLLLWDRGSTSSYRFRFIQPEDCTFDDRQNEFSERIRKGEFGTLLLSVQFYKGKLFYSLGDGRNWTKIYIQEVGRWRQTLSDILEENVDPKYFLSEKAMQGLMKGQSKPQLIHCQQEDTQEDTIAQ